MDLSGIIALLKKKIKEDIRERFETEQTVIVVVCVQPNLDTGDLRRLGYQTVFSDKHQTTDVDMRKHKLFQQK